MPLPEPVSAENLRELVDSVSARVEAIAEPEEEIDRDLILVTKTFLHGILAQARIIAWIGDSGAAEAGYSNVRSLFETYLDLRFMLEQPNPKQLAHLVVLYGLQEMLSTISTEERADQPLQEAFEHLVEIDSRAGQMFQSIHGKELRLTWTGRGRKSMMNVFPDAEDLRRQYKGLSWFAHGIIAPIISYNWLPGSSRKREQPELQSHIAAGHRLVAKKLIVESWTVIERAGIVSQ